MRYVEWLFCFIVAGVGIALANFFGFHVPFIESLPGILILLCISALGVAISRAVKLKLPIVAYVSILGLLSACPLSPIREFVISSVGKINFTAPLTMVGAFAGMSISDQIKDFVKQGWKMILIGILVMTGTFVFSAIIGQVMLSVTGVI